MAHFAQKSTFSSCEGANSEQLRSSVVVTAKSLLSEVHYGGRVAAAADRRVLASMLHCTVLPVVELLLKEDGTDREVGCRKGEHNGLQVHSAAAAAKLALQFSSSHCESIQSMIDAVRDMPGLDSTLDLVGIEPDVALASEAQARCSLRCMHAQPAL